MRNSKWLDTRNFEAEEHRKLVFKDKTAESFELINKIFQLNDISARNRKLKYSQKLQSHNYALRKNAKTNLYPTVANEDVAVEVVHEKYDSL